MIKSKKGFDTINKHLTIQHSSFRIPDSFLIRASTFLPSALCLLPSALSLLPFLQPTHPLLKCFGLGTIALLTGCVFGRPAFLPGLFLAGHEFV